MHHVSRLRGVGPSRWNAAVADEESPPPVRVAVRSRYALVRAGLGRLLRSAGPGVVLVAEDAEPAVVVADLAGLRAPEARAELRELAARRTVLGLVRDGHPEQEGEARRLGVRRTVTEGVRAGALLAAVEALVEEAAAPAPALSEREQLTVRLVAAGLSNPQIAAEMFVSVNSVKTYVRTAYRKMGVRTRPEAVLWAVRHGLSDPHRR
jgi:DNA-binding NarL/FixJ family response regulator